MQYNGIICIFGPKNSHFRQLGPYNGLPTSQTACRPAKRPPTGKPKVSGVTSGYLIFGPLFGPQRRQKFCFDPVAQRASGRPLQVLVPATVYLILTTVYWHLWYWIPTINWIGQKGPLQFIDSLGHYFTPDLCLLSVQSHKSKQACNVWTRGEQAHQVARLPLLQGS